MNLNTTENSPTRRFLAFFDDRQYFARIFKFALPIAMQQLIFTSMNLVGSLMVGQLGATAVASVGLAGQVFFLMNLVVFGIGSGAAIFTAQLWGKQDIPNIRKVLGLALLLSLAGALIFFLVAEFFPAQTLGIYSRDPAVIELGSQLLKVLGFTFPFFAVTATFSLILRSVGEVRLPVSVSISALILNTVLSYALIFGKFGFPQLGAVGAMYGMLISRSIETLVLVSLTYYLRLPPAGKLNELFAFNRVFARTALNPIVPVLINEILWSLGITTYQIIYARMGTEQLAAVNISTTIADLAVVVFIGLGSATGILVGNLIGSGDTEQAYRYAGRSLSISLLGGVLFGMFVLVLSPLILNLYKVSPEVINYARSVLLINCSFLWLRMMNMVLFIGIFRAGGDTRFALILDGVLIWVVGVPLTLFGAFGLHLPIYLVYALTMSEELTKWGLGLWRFFSRRWIHNVAETVAAVG